MKYGNTWSLFPYFLFEIVSKKGFNANTFYSKMVKKGVETMYKKEKKRGEKGQEEAKTGVGVRVE
ncbi:MAG TPA: hypothetical protein IAD13_06380 [Bacteroidetes bacterium]|nr:hypothetical protein [Candidatus Limimorpha avicola]